MDIQQRIQAYAVARSEVEATGVLIEQLEADMASDYYTNHSDPDADELRAHGRLMEALQNARQRMTEAAEAVFDIAYEEEITDNHLAAAIAMADAMEEASPLIVVDAAYDLSEEELRQALESVDETPREMTREEREEALRVIRRVRQRSTRRPLPF